MRTVFILVATVAACMCSEAGLEKESKVSPNMSGSHRNLRKTGDGQKSADGSTQDGRKDWRNGCFPAWEKRSPIDKDYHPFLEDFEENEKRELRKMCERFQQKEQLVRCILDNICPPEEGLHSSEGRCWLKAIFSHILLGQGVLSSDEEAAKKAYSLVVSYAESTIDEQFDKLLKTLREVYKKFWWSGCNDSQDASGLSEDSQKKENKEDATKTKWQGMTLNERVYHRFLARFYDREEKELKEMCKRLKEREERINLLFADPPREERNRSLRSNLCYIIGLEMEEGIQDETIKRSLKVVISFARKHHITDIRVEEVLETVWEIACELGWDLDGLKDTS
jgi:hypothetical protein